jgi:hypothetical protein
MPEIPANPPTAMAHMASKMPRESHALFLVIDGRVENPEFVVWDRDSFTEELWKWKRRAVRVAGHHVEFWAKHGQHFSRFNPNAV